MCLCVRLSASVCVYRCLLCAIGFELNGAKQVSALEKKIKAVRDRIFRDFSDRVGVEDIGEHDRKMREAQQEREERLGTLRQQLDELELDRERLVRSISDYEGKKSSLEKKEKVCLSYRDTESATFWCHYGHICLDDWCCDTFAM
jgi:septal ring factor EnvC (AmiA/AmiB activator)